MEAQSDAVRRRTCATYVGDMHALELHMLEAFDRQITITKEIRDAHVVVLSLSSTAKRHAQLLNELVSSLGDVEKIVTDKLKSAVTGFFGIAAGLVDTVRPLAASKALRDDYTAVNHAIVGYVMLSTTAAALRNDETKFIADEFLNDYINLAQQIMALIPSLAIRGLSDNGIQVLDFNAAQQFKIDKQWSVLFSRDTIQSQSQTETQTTSDLKQESVARVDVASAENILAPNKIIVEKTSVTNDFSATGRVDKPVVETIVMPVIIEETFRPEKIVEVQPVIHREVRAPEIHHIERHIYEKVEAVGPHVVTNKPIIEEVIKPVIIEEVQEVIHRELPAPYVEKIEQHVTEVEVMPTLHTKEVILEKEEVLEADLVIENVDVEKITKVPINKKITKETTTSITTGISAGAPVGLADVLPRKP